MWYAIYNSIFYQPMYNLLIGFYNVIPGHDLGLAVIGVTILTRLVLYPLSLKSIKAQKMMQDLQPKLEELKKRHAKDKEKQAAETMKLYREEKINPFSSCLPLLLQLPFLIALFHVLQNVTNPDSLTILYNFIPSPGQVNAIGLFGWVDLAKTSLIIALLAGAAQFWQGFMLLRQRPPIKNSATKDEDFSTMVNQQMTYIMPVMTAYIAWRFPAGVSLYWFVSTLLLALQQWYIFKKNGPAKPYDDSPREITSSAS
jgi:YidC/Oxa1 family membrane protein insertase